MGLLVGTYSQSKNRCHLLVRQKQACVMAVKRGEMYESGEVLSEAVNRILSEESESV
jgi:hypothetical protein